MFIAFDLRRPAARAMRPQLTVHFPGDPQQQDAADEDKPDDLQAEGEAQRLKGTGQDVKGSIKGVLGDKI